jgi:bifunctional DNA-binding transcriptional regulator/antitoxin component of YhaV-PrlF toxin-antitoxin module
MYRFCGKNCPMGTIEPLRETTPVVTLSEDGEVSIPESLRGELGFRIGDRLVTTVVDGALVVRSMDAGIRRAQEIAMRYVVEGVSVVDELIADRRADAERD